MPTENTEWALTTLGGTEIFNFSDVGDIIPEIENMSALVQKEEIHATGYNLVKIYDRGLGKRQISLQGLALDDNDLWELNAAVYDRRLKKLWLGSDWFCYVLGVGVTNVRDERAPLQKSYNISFDCPDPCFYYANTGGNKGSQYETNCGVVSEAGSEYADVTLSDTGENSSSFFVEPVIWIETSGSFTAVSVTDENNRQLSWSGSASASHTLLFLPYARNSYEGFKASSGVGFDYNGVDKNEVTNWALDFERYSTGSNKLNNPTELSFNLSHSGTGYTKTRYYPRAESYITDPENSGSATRFTISLTGTYSACYLQYLYRRI